MGVLKAWPFLLSVVGGGVGFCGELWALPCCALLIPAWTCAGSRLRAFFVAWLYYAAASHGLIQTTAVFLCPDAPAWEKAVLLWGAANALLSLPWGLFWHPSVGAGLLIYATRLTLCLLLTVIPPLGLIGWSSPLTAAGVLFPDAGWLGVVVWHLLLVGFREKQFGFFMGASAVFLAVLSLGAYEPLARADWAGLNTSLGEVKSHDAAQQFDVAEALQEELARVSANAVLLPETVGGVWTKSTHELWEKHADSQAPKAILLGTLFPERDGYRNGLVVLSEGPPRALFQRVPIPIGMWKPWSKDHVRSDVFSSGVHEVLETKVALFMCYEQSLVWPIFLSALERPEVALAPANLWFSRGTRTNQIRHTVSRSWARLFGWQLVEAVNL